MKIALSLLFSLLLQPLALGVDFGRPEIDGAWSEVVAIARIEEDGLGQIFCSGVLLAPKVVLTAAHCLQSGGVRPGSRQLRELARELRVYQGPGAEGGLVSEGLTAIERIHLHPDYLRETRGQADLAVIVLKEVLSAPRVNVALDIALLKLELRRFQQLSVVGFGHSEQRLNAFATEERFGIKHRGPVVIENKTADELYVLPGPALDSYGLFRPAPREGDSGGPVFYQRADGSYTLVALVSRATKMNHGPRGMAMTQIRPWICWIERVAQIELKPPGSINFCELPIARQQVDHLRDVPFLEQCLNPETPASARYTIDVMKKLFGRADCYELEAFLSKQTNLSLDATYINDLSPLQDFTQLERLILRDNHLTSVLPLIHHKELRTLDISYNRVRDFELLQDRPGLWLVGTKRQDHTFGDAQFIRECQNPSSTESARTVKALLDQFEMRASDCVNAHYELLRRRELEFYQVQGLTDMTPLHGLTTLERLNLKGQSVTDLGFLGQLDDLRELILDDNPVEDLSPVLVHRNLTLLSLEGLGLQNLNVPAQLPRLRQLLIGRNSIRDFGPLAERERRGILEITGKDQQILAP